ncbi:MAG TPA: PQQ-binding-like beta-propeller repeat protein [Bryobacteraceae bacterium]|nr:PQQ-binding-like beta-propeller repeat protein [Bryobacteraceae bacterium]
MRLVILLSIAFACHADWVQFRGNPELTGVTTATPPKAPRVLWTYETGDAVESSAAIVGGVVYVGVGTGEVVALDLQTGKLRWKYKAGEGIGESSPAVVGGVVYIGDLTGTLHAINAADGKPKWVFKTAGEIKSSPVVTEGKVIVGSYDGSLYAVDAATGAQAWQYRTGAQVHATPAVVGGLTFISGCDGILRAIRIADGKQAYEVQIGSYTGASPAIHGQFAYFGTFDNEVMGADLQKRKIAWRYENPKLKFPFYATAAVVNGKVYIGGRDKLMHAFDAKSGKELWSFATKARIDSSAVVTPDGRLFFGSNDGNLYAVDAATGKEVWKFSAGAPISASPAMDGDRIVISAQDGRVYCLGK